MAWLYIALAVTTVIGFSALIFAVRERGKNNKTTSEQESRVVELQTLLNSEQAQHEETKKTAQENRAQDTEDLKRLRAKESENAATIAGLQEALKNAETREQEHSQNLENTKNALKEEFANLSQTILDQKSEKFDETSQNLLNPLKNEITAFRERVDHIYNTETEGRTALKTEIENLYKYAEKISQDANNLAASLKGNSKAQGEWGEMQLNVLLENSGLVKDQGYFLQESLTTDDDKLQRPDAIIKLPDERSFVVDSKVSLRAFADAMDEKDRDSQKALLKEHARAVKKHVDDLSKKSYPSLPGIKTPNMTFMFMAVEPALNEALREEPGLLKYAYEKRVILCSPMTLMAVLRAAQHVWISEAQSKNAEKIARRGELLYDKFFNFLENMNEIKKGLNKAEDAYQDARKQLETGDGNLIDQAKKLQDLGITSKKGDLPKLKE